MQSRAKSNTQQQQQQQTSPSAVLQSSYDLVISTLTLSHQCQHCTILIITVVSPHVFNNVHVQLVSWCSWLSHSPNTRKVPSSILGESKIGTLLFVCIIIFFHRFTSLPTNASNDCVLVRFLFGLGVCV